MNILKSRQRHHQHHQTNCMSLGPDEAISIVCATHTDRFPDSRDVMSTTMGDQKASKYYPAEEEAIMKKVRANSGSNSEYCGRRRAKMWPGRSWLREGS